MTQTMGDLAYVFPHYASASEDSSGCQPLVCFPTPPHVGWSCDDPPIRTPRPDEG